MYLDQILQKVKKLLVLLFSLVLSGTTFSAELDSVLTIKNSPFFKDLLNKKDPIQPLRSPKFGFISPQHKDLKRRTFQFFTLQKQLYLHFNGSGLLYQLDHPNDSILTFKRIDDTENYNYNLEAFLFTHGNEIYNIGGYGYWRTSGTLRKYNYKDFEWDAEPVDQEIHMPYADQLGTFGQLAWFNTYTQHLYIPYQRIINEGVKTNKEDEQYEKKVYRLDLKTKIWKKLGKTHPDYFELLQNTKWVIPTDSGQLICFNHKVYQINFEENTIKENDDPSLTQSLERIDVDHVAYYHNQTIYYLNGKTQQYDSVKVRSASFEKSDFKVWKKSNTGTILGIAPIFIILAAAAARKREAKKKRAEVLESAQQQKPIGAAVKIKFNQTERQLLRLLLDKSKQNETTNITEINYALGIKDKNIGLQKKVRSDVMNSINEKFNFLQEDDTDLICNLRSQEDKRYFEYFIDKSNIELLEIMLKEGDD